MKGKRFDRVGEAIKGSPAAAFNMKARSDLTIAIRKVVESWLVTQAVAAKQLGVTQPRRNAFLHGRIDRFDRVGEAIEDSPAAAVNMKARSDLMIAIRKEVESWTVTQAAAAKQLGITQPRLNDLLRGRIAKFSLDALMKLASHAGLAVRVELSAAPLTVPSPQIGAPPLTVNQDSQAVAQGSPRRQRRIPVQKAKKGTGKK